VTTSDAATSLPADPETLQRYVMRLREAYHRENAYVKQLEATVRQQERVVWYARDWHKARGMHRKPALDRLRDAVVQLEDELARST
jgi:hypothetical protein